MCTDDYVEEHPCDEPYMLDDRGQCDLLIEDHINAQGPSRRVLLAYHAGILVVCFGLSLQRLWHAWTDASSQRRRLPLRDFLIKDRTVGLVCQICAFFLGALRAVDPDGYGGRYPLVLAYILRDLSSFFLIMGARMMLYTWTAALSIGLKAGGPTHQLKTTTRNAGGVFLLVSLAAGPLVIYPRPSDAGLGVVNGFFIALRTLGATLFLFLICTGTIREYLELQKLLHGFDQRMVTARVVPVPSSQGPAHERTRTGLHVQGAWMKSAAEDRSGASRSNADQPCSPRTTERPRVPHAFAPQSRSAIPIPLAWPAPSTTKPSSRTKLQTPSISTAHVSSPFRRSRSLGAVADSHAASVHQLRKFVILMSIVVLGVFVDSVVVSIRGIRDCWLWGTPPDSQWVETGSLIQLFGAVALVTSSMKTFRICK